MTQQRTTIRLPDGVDRETFLRDYWQKKPLLMRAAISPQHFQLMPDELAGLACESEFESRLIIEQSETAWTVQHGPFDEQDFASLPESHWTLLVQDVDKFVPDVAALIDLFDFVPGWRIDDIMISYATDQGGVGPHTDAYDVFLMQAQGRRRWRISDRRYTDDDLIPGLEQRILSHFTTSDDWLLEPGDILYLPPGVAHWGTAEGDCMTYSLGFRSPNQQELAADWFQYLVDHCAEQRLQDPDDIDTDHLGQITPGAIDNAARLFAGLPTLDSAAFALWLGDHLTEAKTQFQIEPPESPWSDADLTAWLRDGHALVRHPFARLAWQVLPDGPPALFYQGEHRIYPAAATATVNTLCTHRRLDAPTVSALLADNADSRAVVLDLLNEGVLEAEDADE